METIILSHKISKGCHDNKGNLIAVSVVFRSNMETSLTCCASCTTDHGFQMVQEEAVGSCLNEGDISILVTLRVLFKILHNKLLSSLTRLLSI
jgi:hypothetical protein